VNEDRLSRQIAFLVEADKLKTILRRTPIGDGTRAENSAEHSWHLAVAAMTLAEYAPPDVNRGRVIELLTVHDLVEIDAGDTFAYDTAGYATKAARELAAAERIFGLLPPDQGAYFRGCWDEFEAHVTIESKYANALDRFQALLQNLAAGGGSWRAHGVSRDDVLRRMAPVQRDVPQLWPFVMRVIDQFCETGAITPGTTT
jgi:putative hydrolase of HD superfamily